MAGGSDQAVIGEVVSGVEVFDSKGQGLDLAERGWMMEGFPIRQRLDEDRSARMLVRPMREADIGGVMAIEIAAFRDPWTPLAFVMDLRHNPCAHYDVMLDADGVVAGYLGWWNTPEVAVIVRVAVAPTRRGSGVGHALVAEAANQAREAGCRSLRLEVRAANEGARAFYSRLGFAQIGYREAYYDDPADDAVVMGISLVEAVF